MRNNYVYILIAFAVIYAIRVLSGGTQLGAGL